MLCILRAVIFYCKTAMEQYLDENAIQVYLNGTANYSLSNGTVSVTKMCSFVKFCPRQFWRAKRFFNYVLNTHSADKLQQVNILTMCPHFTMGKNYDRIATSLAEMHYEVLNSICCSITETLFQFWLKTIYWLLGGSPFILLQTSI